MPPALLFFLGLALDIQAKNCIAFVVELFFFYSYEFQQGHLGMSLDSMNILTRFVLMIHEHRISFHLFVSSSNSFIKIL